MWLSVIQVTLLTCQVRTFLIVLQKQEKLCYSMVTPHLLCLTAI